MKKFITIIFTAIVTMVAFSINANAQWITEYYEGDELKGTSSHYANGYFGDCGHFTCSSTNTKILIATDRGIFDYNSNRYNSDHYVSVTVGFYEKNILVEKVETRFYVPNGNSDTAISSKDLGEKIINHLKNVGNVRIIASKYSGADFDLTIPMNPDIK